VELYGIGRDQDTFAAQQRAAISGFDDATPDNQSFEDKMQLICSRSLSSSVKPLTMILHSSFKLMGRAFKEFKNAHVALYSHYVTSKNCHASLRKEFEERFEEAKDTAIKERFTHIEVLGVLKEGLDFDDWPEDDAAVPFIRLKHNEPTRNIPGGRISVLMCHSNIL
jgi:hypothetical protein